MLNFEDQFVHTIKVKLQAYVHILYIRHSYVIKQLSK